MRMYHVVYVEIYIILEVAKYIYNRIIRCERSVVLQRL